MFGQGSTSRSRNESVIQSPAAEVWIIPIDVDASLALEVEDVGAVALG